MRIFLFFLLFTSSLKAQVSYEFMEALPPDGKDIRSVDPQHYGVYTSDNSEIKLEFNASGVYARNIVIQRISRDTLRESSRYFVRNDHIFGVSKKDSLPCVQDGDFYYFGMERLDTLISGKSANKMRKISANEYLINFAENGTYTPCLITLNSGKLQLRYFDYPSDQPVFSVISKQQQTQVNGMNTVYLLPTPKEWKKIDRSKIFGSSIDYTKK